MKEKSELIRGTSKCARFFICDTTEIVKEAKSIHNLDPVATMLFGKSHSSGIDYLFFNSSQI